MRVTSLGDGGFGEFINFSEFVSQRTPIWRTTLGPTVAPMTMGV
jgi:hypothetical protein